MKTRLKSWEEAAHKLAEGELVVLPTDTLYGVVASATNPKAVAKVYDIRRREHHKPVITLLSDVQDLAIFQIGIPPRTKNVLSKVWPGPVSVIVAVDVPELQYIHRGTNSIAFRVPRKPVLQDLIRKVGPIVAPSANVAGDTPATSAEEAHAFFGDAVWYLDEGPLAGSASALVDIRGNEPKILRPAPGFDVRSLG
jgi:L-threonylcarbamoyladenylate synthase